MMKRGVIDEGWQTYAWSSGKLSGYAEVYQYHNGANVCGIVCDLDESYGNEGFWNLKGVYNSQAVPSIAKFQSEHGLAADNVVGPLTTAKLLEEAGKADELQGKIEQVKKDVE